MNKTIEKFLHKSKKHLALLSIAEFNAVKAAFESLQTIKSLKLSAYDEDNDEGGSYRIYDIENINQISINIEMNEDWDEDIDHIWESDNMKQFLFKEKTKKTDLHNELDIIITTLLKINISNIEHLINNCKILNIKSLDLIIKKMSPKIKNKKK